MISYLRNKISNYRRRVALLNIRIMLAECGYDVSYMNDEQLEAMWTEMCEKLRRGLEACSVSAEIAAMSLGKLATAVCELDQYGCLNAKLLTDELDDEFLFKTEWRPPKPPTY